jgi:hypothetical protein
MSEPEQTEQSEQPTAWQKAWEYSETALEVAEVPAEMAGYGIPPVAMGMSWAHAAKDASEGDAEGAMCSMQRSIPMIGPLYVGLTGACLPDLTEQPGSSPDERAAQACFDPETTRLETPEEMAQRQMAEDEQRAQACVQP